MRTTIVIVSVFLLSVLSVPLWAQMHSQETKSESTTMMGDGSMMGGNSTMGSDMYRGRMMPGNKMGYGMMDRGMRPGSMCSMCGMMGRSGMHKGMMGRGMMGNRMSHFMKVIYHLPGMETRLEFTQDQTSRLKELQSEFLKNKADWKAEIEKKHIDLDNQLENEADSSQIRKTLEAISKVKIDKKVSGYETALQMISVLQPEQKKMLKNLCSSQQTDPRGMMMGTQHN